MDFYVGQIEFMIPHGWRMVFVLIRAGFLWLKVGSFNQKEVQEYIYCCLHGSSYIRKPKGKNDT